MIPSPSPSVKIKIIGGKVYVLEVIRHNIAGWCQQTFVFKSLLSTPSNILPLHLKQTFLPIVWIFTGGKGDGIESRLPFKIFSTLSKSFDMVNYLLRQSQHIVEHHCFQSFHFQHQEFPESHLIPLFCFVSGSVSEANHRQI